jgi:hypothetical protein
MKRDITVPLSIGAIFGGLGGMLWFGIYHPSHTSGFGPAWIWPIEVLLLCGVLRTMALWFQTLFDAVQSQSIRSVIGIIALGPFGAWIYYFKYWELNRNQDTQPEHSTIPKKLEN